MTDFVLYFLYCIFKFIFFILYFWKFNLYSRCLIFALWYLLSILYLYESNLQCPFSLRDVIMWLLAWLLSALLILPFLPQVTFTSLLPLLLYVTHLTTSSTLCRMLLSKKQNRNTNPVISGLDYHLTQPCHQRKNKQTENSAQISPYIKILKKVQSSQTEPGRNRNYEQPNYKHWNWNSD